MKINKRSIFVPHCLLNIIKHSIHIGVEAATVTGGALCLNREGLSKLNSEHILLIFMKEDLK